jgi:hypothetical protein
MKLSLAFCAALIICIVVVVSNPSTAPESRPLFGKQTAR